ncbi:universal stress protein [candidate division KSB1 bacterium]|nr:universal stress protein [candidate division KSB1 bacterium]
MKILVATAGYVPAKEKADYVINIAKRSQAEIFALHILAEDEEEVDGRQALNLFSEAGQAAGIRVFKMLKKADIVSAIIDTAVELSADLIIMGASQGKVVSEWLSADVLRRSEIPVVVIPHDIPISK